MKKEWRRRFCLLLTVLALLLAGCGSAESTADQEEPKPPAGEALALPCVLEDGRLVVENIFQYSGMNPDHSNEEGRETAALEVCNASVLHLENARLTLTVEDGSEIDFVIRDLPAGATVMVFSQENLPMTEGSQRELACEADFTEEAPMAQGRIDTAVEGMNITLTNVSGEPLENVKVSCHSLLEGKCYGGVTYEYTIDEIEAGAAVTVEAADCYLDGALPVRIEG